MEEETSKRDVLLSKFQGVSDEEMELLLGVLDAHRGKSHCSININGLFSESGIVLKRYPRRYGKTTSVQVAMMEDPKLYCLVPVRAMKDFYPLELRDRVFSFHEFSSPGSWMGKVPFVIKVVVDEAFLGNMDSAIQLAYLLGKNHINTLFIGT